MGGGLLAAKYKHAIRLSVDADLGGFWLMSIFTKNRIALFCRADSALVLAEWRSDR